MSARFAPLPPELNPEIAHHAELDARMVRVARGIKLLTLASWPAGIELQFLADYARGVAQPPQIEYPKLDFGDTRAELEAIAREADADHPLGHYIIDAARSWGTAAQLAESLGTPEVTTHSVRLFGKPDEALPGNGPTTRCWRRPSTSRCRRQHCACNCNARSTTTSTTA